jgi:hypothetical protein
LFVINHQINLRTLNAAQQPPSPSICRLENTASTRAMQKLSMSFVEERPHPKLGYPLDIYAI